MSSEKNYQKLLEHDQKFLDHDKRFDRIEERLDSHDDQLERIALAVYDNQQRITRIEENMATKSDIQQVLDHIDGFMKKTTDNAQKILMLGNRVTRIEENLVKNRE